MMSGFEWLSFGTNYFTVEALSLAVLLLGIYSRFLGDRTDWCISKRKGAFLKWQPVKDGYGAFLAEESCGMYAYVLCTAGTVFMVCKNAGVKNRKLQKVLHLIAYECRVNLRRLFTKDFIFTIRQTFICARTSAVYNYPLTRDDENQSPLPEIMTKACTLLHC